MGFRLKTWSAIITIIATLLTQFSKAYLCLRIYFLINELGMSYVSVP